MRVIYLYYPEKHTLIRRDYYSWKHRECCERFLDKQLGGASYNERVSCIPIYIHTQTHVHLANYKEREKKQNFFSPGPKT